MKGGWAGQSGGRQQTGWKAPENAARAQRWEAAGGQVKALHWWRWHGWDRLISRALLAQPPPGAAAGGSALRAAGRRGAGPSAGPRRGAALSGRGCACRTLERPRALSP